jgi:hypothetical protein
MADKIIIFVAHILEVAFFVGLVGSVLMIVESWVDICFDSSLAMTKKLLGRGVLTRPDAPKTDSWYGARR